MTITATVIEDSVSRDNIRLTTLQLRYPRFIHADFMTHRVFSRNASSSRAIPVDRLIKDVRRDPALPVFWGKNQKGMQAREEVHPLLRWMARTFWLGMMWIVTSAAYILSWMGLHKQIVNRMIEPWAHINVVVTATDWDNFFQLRNHPDAQPEIQVLAQAMLKAMQESIPTRRNHHLPFVLPEEREQYSNIECQRISSARCARTSYLTHERAVPSVRKDLKLASDLWKDKHLSPLEHQAEPTPAPEMRCYNLQGWHSQRYDMEFTA